jgi:Group II intron, maturase-specific domain
MGAFERSRWRDATLMGIESIWGPGDGPFATALDTGWVLAAQERKFLGFSFAAGPEVKRVMAPEALDPFKQRGREITRRAKGVSMKTTMEELAPYVRGRRSYFRIHGLTGKSPFLPGEDPAALRDLAESYRAGFQPAGQVAEDLIEPWPPAG